MTAILSYVPSDVTFQVSDRLVSAVRGPMVDPFDRTANKGIVVGAYDGVFAIGYTGVAYLGDTPTDTWLTAWVAGGYPAGGMSLRPNVPLHLQAIAGRIQFGLEELFRAGGARYNGFGHEVVIAGRQYRRGNEQIPILWKVRRTDLSMATFEIVRENLEGLRRGQGSHLEPTGNVPQEVLEVLRAELASLDPEGSEIENRLVVAIRECARVVRGVGQDVMVVTILAEGSRVLVEYRPADPSERVVVGNGGHELPPAYTPAYIGHTAVVPPAHFDSFRGFAIDGLDVVNATPGERAYWDETSGTWIAGWAAQPRKSPPVTR